MEIGTITSIVSLLLVIGIMLYVLMQQDRQDKAILSQAQTIASLSQGLHLIPLPSREAETMRGQAWQRQVADSVSPLEEVTPVPVPVQNPN